MTIGLFSKSFASTFSKDLSISFILFSILFNVIKSSKFSSLSIPISADLGTYIIDFSRNNESFEGENFNISRNY